ncbi:2Fe-2S iron-sulfur cluster-binding protein [Halomonas dongshanensis]|uniref:2Fe-2S iron-sulfur cluster-binding protein n=1 Tax=Halomonas dongshanensis TaxID=2890835 RepID=A0ABT2EHV6_9GAMM|nr:2Fe-2S iron-sulfur cluster-binding protein [Halomonas dongshanensis]MCS2611130.1 2Fe-2S iron-sulfur cluster-binding protein [Halomonas dongshanensis]
MNRYEPPAALHDTATDRLAAPMGRRIDRQAPRRFQFEGTPYAGYAGDTLASALIANGRYLLSRSFKYHRPRGPLTLAGQDANTLVQLPDEPNVLADTQPLTEGLSVYGQNYAGSLDADRDMKLGALAKFMPVGFYYRAFYKPKGVWKYWEPLIRKKAGLGVFDLDADAGYHDKAYLFADVAVVGSGPAGLKAALTAADGGARVLLIEQEPELGGALTYARFATDTAPSERLLDDLVAEVEAHDNIRLLCNATCNGWFKDHYLPVIQGRRLYKVRAKACIVASGAFDQPAIFRNNDLPGIMLASAAQRLMRHYAIKPGQRAVVLTGNDDGYLAALDLVEQGVEVAALVDMRAAPNETKLGDAVEAQGIARYREHTIFEAHHAKAHHRVTGVELRPIAGRGEVGEARTDIACDVVCMSAGYMPAYQLLCQAGGKLSYCDETAQFAISGLPKRLYVAGSANGFHALDRVVHDGARAATQALRDLGHQVDVLDAPKGALEQVNYPWPMFAHPKGKEFVDFDEDLQIADIINATRHGYRDVQLVKRFSTVGMGPSQGRHSALPTARLVAAATERSVSDTGVTTARPPFAAETLAHLAGRHFDPFRQTPMHRRHVELGAHMMPAGDWQRPAYYPSRAGTLERLRCQQEEARHVREKVGIIDVSTLGGIEVRGPDAAEFINRIYTFGFLKQPIGRTRYAAMTNEQGVVIDDGVSCRLAEDHFYVTATTSGVGRVYQSMLQWNAQWRLDVDIANVTSAYAAVNVAGPLARQLLERVCTGVDLSAEAFPYLGLREGFIGEAPAYLLRVGFVGELGFELHVPSRYGEYLWDTLMEAGKDLELRPFGVEAQRLLRLEKGHVIIGQDTDGMSHPFEINMGWAVNRTKPFFVGRRAVDILHSHPPLRRLVGFRLPSTSAKPLEGHLVLEGERISGNVTSCEYSPTLDAIIGLAYAAPERGEPGQRITIRTEGGETVTADVVALPFFDPDNQRQEL